MTGCDDEKARYFSFEAGRMRCDHVARLSCFFVWRRRSVSNATAAGAQLQAWKKVGIRNAATQSMKLRYHLPSFTLVLCSRVVMRCPNVGFRYVEPSPPLDLSLL